MANIIHACVRFIPLSDECQTFDWCHNVDLDTATEEDLYGQAELYLASLQAGFASSDRLNRPIDCDYQIVLMTAFPET